MTKRLTRLEHLIRVLEKVKKKPRAAFNLGLWGIKFETKDQFANRYGLDIDEVPPCKTVACVGGWCGLDPYFRRNGFKTDLKKGDLSINDIKMYSNHQLMGFFGLTYDEVEYLFYTGPNNNYQNTKISEVITYAKKLVKKYGRTNRTK